MPRQGSLPPTIHLGLFAALASCTLAQEQRPAELPAELPVGKLPADLVLDGRLDEPVWGEGPAIESLTTIVPVEGGKPNGATRVRVLASTFELVIGLRCEDPEPDRIVSYSVARDSGLGSEDHVRIVLGTFLDGRTGYVFAVNPSGARYDALVANRGEGTNSNWDAVWEAKTHRGAFGWSAEIRIPVQSLSFKKGLRRWHFNIQRRVQRLLETSRWASPQRDYDVMQTSQAGYLTGLPDFDQGLGLTVTSTALLSYGKDSRSESLDLEPDASLDVSWRITPALVGTLTANTDFAETEVDTRRSNLTRFPLFFPEKRRFFLEGADAFDFGLGLRRDIVPFHSRRIGLVGGREVPLLGGGKLTGRVGGTSLGALVTKTDDKVGVAPESTMGVLRLRQDVLAESNVGLIATAGDPLDRDDSWMAGVDATYQTSELFGNRNFLVGVWGLTMDREGMAGGSKSAYGVKVDYPNDRWDIVFQHTRIGEDFDPSLGFVRRSGIKRSRFAVDFAPRPDVDWLRQTSYEASLVVYTDLNDHWQTYRLFTAPINWDLESGDTIEFNTLSEGDRLDEDFEISDGVTLLAGEYEWTRYRLTFEGARKRPISGEVSWWFGPFYDGHLDTIEVDLRLVPATWLTLDLAVEHNHGRMPQGSFTEDLYSARILFNISPDLTFKSFLQYDNDSKMLGASTRMRWTVTPLSDVFFVFDYNLAKVGSHLRAQSYESAVKLQHSFRF